MTMDELARWMEGEAEQPVVNETGLQGRWSFSFRDRNTYRATGAVLVPGCNLRLKPARRAIEVLVVEDKP
jgi:uncharacterized protein (TIGR03435 family)